MLERNRKVADYERCDDRDFHAVLICTYNERAMAEVMPPADLGVRVRTEIARGARGTARVLRILLNWAWRAIRGTLKFVWLLLVALGRAAASAAELVPTLSAQFGRYARLMRLHQPVGIWLLLWPTLWALWIAGEGRPDQRMLIVFVLGTIIARSAGCVVNDLADRRIDAHVRRTSGRPLATGEVVTAEALILFVGLMLIALGLVLTLNRPTLYFALGGAAVTLIYPFAKRFFSAPQLVLGIAFAWGVPMAYVAQLGSVPRLGWLLFLTALIWVVVYDTEYAMVDRDDDARLGVHSTAILFGEMDRLLIGVLQVSLLVGLVLVGRGAELGVWYYGGLAAAAALCIHQQILIRSRERERCFQAFLNNAWLGVAVFVGILLDYFYKS
jgi:4-hydroxybenzoate polyprenyltransferase